MQRVLDKFQVSIMKVSAFIVGSVTRRRRFPWSGPESVLKELIGFIHLEVTLMQG